MQAMKNVDYVDSSQLRPLPTEYTYAATIDFRSVECEITDFMIRRACEEMESQQQFPFCSGSARGKR